jgi:hypothetical protein
MPLIVLSLSVLFVYTTTSQEVPRVQPLQTPYKLLRSPRQDRPGLPSLQGYDVSVDRFLNRPQIEGLICQVLLNEKPGPSSILGVSIYYKLSEFPPLAIGGARELTEDRLAEYLWNISLPGARRRLIIDRDAEGNQLHVGSLLS